MKILLIMPTRAVPDRLAWRAADAAGRRVGAILEWPQVEPVDRARNLAVERFLGHPEKPTHLCFVDDDSVVDEDALEHLAAMERPIACGCGPVILGGRLCVSVAPKWDGQAEGAWWLSWWLWKAGLFMDADGVKFPHYHLPVRVAISGFPVVLLERRVLETMSYPWFVYNHGDLNGSGRETEDLYFCRRAADAGFEIWCNPLVECGHRRVVDLRDVVPMLDLPLVKLMTAGQAEGAKGDDRSPRTCAADCAVPG